MLSICVDWATRGEKVWDVSCVVLVSSFCVLSSSTSLCFFIIVSSVNWQTWKSFKAFKYLWWQVANEPKTVTVFFLFLSRWFSLMPFWENVMNISSNVREKNAITVSIFFYYIILLRSCYWILSDRAPTIIQVLCDFGFLKPSAPPLTTRRTFSFPNYPRLNSQGLEGQKWPICQQLLAF